MTNFFYYIAGLKNITWVEKTSKIFNGISILYISWNLHERVLNTQNCTNNHAETAYCRLNVQMRVTNPNIYGNL